MKVYIRPQAFQAISFDLDDTLYDNRPIIVQAEAELQSFLHQAYPKSAKWQFADWRRLKFALFRESPELRHDTTAARLAMLERGLLQLGYDAQTAQTGAQAGLDHFVKHRSHFKVSTEVIELLTQLKQKYRLVGITNGNVDHQRIGLEGVFEFVLHPGHGYKQKPSTEMFILAAEKLGLPLASILHIGDSAKSDVDGARRAGCQAVWLNPSFGGTEKSIANVLLPHIEISSVQQLRQLF
ncbi:HAD-IA family hydrolase [Shewanella schlegeliana]|uniref:HAD-IA family hydrolase n=1 Tax=Shewanella schlegeliana TaxID=190308 RepID=A0ABS1T3W8_9GAMM|nr:HAD-IA family hydrolase [Shewanella schlegeliana]MBL4915493.1 HAD-IA family hydrolase [Shewanella schlegeliana]MCL1111806.1 HAD-IA family hydrolase [Shewanella schlegeliana]GIU36599.1 haloacid dehalogenase [Shewanella schlegeliana]